MKHVISWFEIPTTDLERAQKFYEAVFNIEMIPLDLGNLKMRMFPVDDRATDIGGALSYAEGFYKPSATDDPWFT